MHKLLAAVLAAASCVPVAWAQDRAVAHQATGPVFSGDPVKGSLCGYIVMHVTCAGGWVAADGSLGRRPVIRLLKNGDRPSIFV